MQPRHTARNWQIWAAYTRGCSPDGRRGYVTHEQLAQEFGVTRERIRQIVVRQRRLLRSAYFVVFGMSAS